MDFGTAFAIGSTLLSFAGGSSGGDSTTVSGGSGDGGASDLFGFIKKGAKVYTDMRGGADTKPFQQTSSSQRSSSSYYDKFGSKSATSSSTPAASQYAGYRNPDLSTAISNLVNNAQNSQMQQLMTQYDVIQPTIRQGRVTQVNQPSVLSSLGVA